MKPPLLVRILPDRLKGSLFYRRYYPVAPRWHPLFEAATLKYAPSIQMELVPTDILHACIAFTGFYELPLTQRVATLARRGGTMLDVGANAGYFSLLWAAGNPGNRCISFEPSPRNVPLMRRNIQKNKLEGRIQLYPVAAGRSPGRFEFDLGPEDQTGWGGLTERKTANSISVDVVRIDTIVRSSEVIDLLKIDVEGADTWVLLGCERLLRTRSIKEIHFEENKERRRALGIDSNEARDFLRSVGYAASPDGDPDAGVVNWVATPR